VHENGEDAAKPAKKGKSGTRKEHHGCWHLIRHNRKCYRERAGESTKNEGHEIGSSHYTTTEVWQQAKTCMRFGMGGKPGRIGGDREKNV